MINQDFLKNNNMELQIDSHDIFNIIVELEGEFDIEIDPIMLKAENFKSIDTLEKMINNIIQDK